MIPRWLRDRLGGGPVLLCTLVLCLPPGPRQQPEPVPGPVAGAPAPAPGQGPRVPMVPVIPLRGPVSRRQPEAREGAALRGVHYGVPVPVHAALRVGAQTWLGTPGGVVRFAGDLWQEPRGRLLDAITPAQGLPDSAVQALGRGPHGEVLAGTAAGLARLRADGHVLGVELRGTAITALAPGFIGTAAGLYEEASRRQMSQVFGSAHLHVTDLARCQGRLYVATQAHGVLALSPTGGARWRGVQGLPAAQAGRLSACRADGSLLLASVHGVYRIKGLDAQLLPGFPRHATSVCPRPGGLFAGSFAAGLFALLPQTALEPEPVLPGERVVRLFCAAPARGILVGTENALLWRGPDGEVVPVPLLGPPRGPVTALAAHDGAIWAGTFDQGLVRAPLSAVPLFTPWERVPLPEPRITALAVTSPGPAGRLWVGTAAGLFHREKQEAPRPAVDPRGWFTRHINALRAGPGELLVAVYPGLVRIDLSGPEPAYTYFGSRGQERDAGLPSPTIYGLAANDAGLWLGTDGGLALLSHSPAAGRPDPGGGPAGSTAQVLTDLSGVLPDNWLTDVRASSAGLFALTLRDGLLRLGPKENVEVWPVAPGTPLMTSPSALLVFGGRAVLGSNSAGLVVAEPVGADRVRYRTHGPAQGLLSAMITAFLWQPEEDRLWVGGAGGITRIDAARRALGLDED